MLFTRKSFTNGIGRSQEQVQQFAKGVCASTVVVSPVLSYPLTVILQKTQKRTLMTLNQYIEISEWNTRLISCAAQMQEN